MMIHSRLRRRHVGTLWAVALAAVLSIIAPATSRAQSVLTDPNGLAAGSLYRIIFVTSGSFYSGNTDISLYDAFANDAANASGSLLKPLGSTWQAVVSTLAVDAYSHIGGNFSIPVFTMDGRRVADNAADLWDGTIKSPVFVDELGVAKQGGAIVNTGTNADGSSAASPLGGNGPTDPGYISGGDAGFQSGGWICCRSHEGLSTRPIYGISGTLMVGGGTPPTVAPEPSTYALMTAGLVALGLVARRKQSRANAAL